jgi:hypothetical protein
VDVRVHTEAEETSVYRRDGSEVNAFGLDAVTVDMESAPVGDPGGFAHWAGVTVGDDDSVTVQISIDDPRSAFAMTGAPLHRKRPALPLTVPNPQDGAPHMRLTEVRPGFYHVAGM